MSRDEAEELLKVVGARLQGADAATVRIVTSIVGLLATIAYADREIGPEEEVQLRQELSRIHGLDAAGVEVIAELLSQHIVRLSTSFATRFTRMLREEADRELKLEVVEILLRMAASDGKITTTEVVALRNTVQALGLTQAEYNELQAQHRELLSVLA